MDHPQHDHPNGMGRPPFFKSPGGIALAMVGVIVAFFVVREHWAHIVGNLSYLILLACPLMHLFGHGHGGHHHSGGTPTQRSSDSDSTPNKKDW